MEVSVFRFCTYFLLLPLFQFCQSHQHEPGWTHGGQRTNSQDRSDSDVDDPLKKSASESENELIFEIDTRMAAKQILQPRNVPTLIFTTMTPINNNCSDGMEYATQTGKCEKFSANITADSNFTLELLNERYNKTRATTTTLLPRLGTSATRRNRSRQSTTTQKTHQMTSRTRTSTTILATSGSVGTTETWPNSTTLLDLGPTYQHPNMTSEIPIIGQHSSKVTEGIEPAPISPASVSIDEIKANESTSTLELELDLEKLPEDPTVGQNGHAVVVPEKTEADTQKREDQTGQESLQDITSGCGGRETLSLPVFGLVVFLLVKGSVVL